MPTVVKSLLHQRPRSKLGTYYTHIYSRVLISLILADLDFYRLESVLPLLRTPVTISVQETQIFIWYLRTHTLTLIRELLQHNHEFTPIYSDHTLVQSCLWISSSITLHLHAPVASPRKSSLRFPWLSCTPYPVPYPRPTCTRPNSGQVLALYEFIVKLPSVKSKINLSPMASRQIGLPSNMANGKASRWENSRLRQRVLLSSVPEDNDVVVGGSGGGGARLHPHGGSTTANSTGYRATEMVAGAGSLNMAVGGAVNLPLANNQPAGLVSGFTSSLYNRNPTLAVSGTEGAALTAMPGQVNMKLTTPPNEVVYQAATTTGPQQSMHGLGLLAANSAGSSPASGISPGSNVSRGSMGSTFLARGIIPTNRRAPGPRMSPNCPQDTPLSLAGGVIGSQRQTLPINQEEQAFLMNFLREKASGATQNKTVNQGANQIKIVQPPPGLGFTGPRVFTNLQGQHTGPVEQQPVLGYGISGSLDGAGDSHVGTQTPVLQMNGSTKAPGSYSKHLPVQAHQHVTGQIVGTTPANTPANTPTKTPTNTRRLKFNPFRPASRGGPTGMMGNAAMGNSQPARSNGSQLSSLNSTPARRTPIFGGANHGSNISAQAVGAVGAVIQQQQPPKGIVLHLGGGGPDFLRPLAFPPVREEIRLLRSDWLNRLTGTEGMPSYQALLNPENVPFIEAWRLTGRPNTAVVCISNIPYDVTRAEIIAFLGRSARIPNDKFEPVHIIMDRTTSKTNDCYVEFNTLHDAINAVNKHRMAVDSGRHPRIGKRSVELTLSSHGKLMKNLFPFAKGFTHNSFYPWENFKGMITKEEMISLCKHAECPNHSPFALNCPERVYECLISTIMKMPWYMSDRITVKERAYIYSATEKMITLLITRIQKGEHSTRLTPLLLERLADAAMGCPGFTVMQKDNIAWLVNMQEYKLGDFHMPRFADGWTHLHALSVKPGVPLDVVEYYIALIREETNRVVDRVGIQRMQMLKDEQAKTSDYWGFF
ncbi:hypothetical protein K449DRAFT_424342 [Hypoxylon sp. EC38]|nr:hypothetical protein K449DRAFT_424342 [Hypoxylon sp. EC38]